MLASGAFACAPGLWQNDDAAEQVVMLWANRVRDDVVLGDSVAKLQARFVGVSRKLAAMVATGTSATGRTQRCDAMRCDAMWHVLHHTTGRLPYHGDVGGTYCLLYTSPSPRDRG